MKKGWWLSVFFIFGGIIQQAIAQQVELIVVEDSTRLPIENYSITGFIKGKQKKLTNLVDVTTYESCDSLVVQSFGYKNRWIKGAKIPGFMKSEPKVTMYIALIPLFKEMFEVVVSAAKFSESKNDVARKIDIITRQDIQFGSLPNLGDVLQNSGQVLVQKSQLGGGSPIIRGFEGNKVMIVVDGVRMNNAIYRGGHLQNVLRIDNSILERVEIVHGPGSIVYGSDALGGVMHFTTLMPKTKPMGDTSKVYVKAGAFVRASSAADETSGNFNFNLGWNKVASLSSFSYTQLGHLRQGSVGLGGEREAWKNSYFSARINDKDSMFTNTNPLVQQNSGFTQFDLMQKILWTPSSKAHHLLNIQYSTTNNVPRYDRLNLTDSAQSAQIPANRFTNENPTTNKLRNAEWYYGPEQRLLAAYSLTLFDKKEKVSQQGATTTTYAEKGRITAAYQDITESRHTRPFGNNKLTSRTERVQVGSVNADFQHLKNKNELRYGAEVVYNKVTSIAKAVNIVTAEETTATTRYPVGGSSMVYGAAYATYHREINSKWVLNSGLRANFVSLEADFGDTAKTKFPFSTAKQSKPAINGQLGIVYKAYSGWRFSALVSSGFRAPNVDDLAKVFDSNPADSVVIVPNDKLSPEYTYNGEITIVKFFKNAIIEATGWYTLYRDAITTQPFAYNGSNTYVYDGVPSRIVAQQNATNAYLYGASLTAKWKFIKGFEASGTINYTYGRIETDSTPYPLDHIPPLYGRAGVKWGHEKITTELFTLFNGAKKVKDYNMMGEDNFYDATINGMPAWYTINIRGAYQISAITTLQLSIENILDQNYRVFASGISAPGRNFVATVRVQL